MNEESFLKLNTLRSENKRLRKRRVGRGDKTCGKGHKGQRSRAGGGTPRMGRFEGGQMPLHMRLAKLGFSKKSDFVRVPFSALLKVKEDSIDISLMRKYKIVSSKTKKVKLYLNNIPEGSQVNKNISFGENIRVSKGIKLLLNAE